MTTTAHHDGELADPIPPLVQIPGRSTWPGPMQLTRTLPVIDRTEEPLRHMGEWLRRDPRTSGFDGVLMAFTVEEFAAFSNRLGGRP